MKLLRHWIEYSHAPSFFGVNIELWYVKGVLELLPKDAPSHLLSLNLVFTTDLDFSKQFKEACLLVPIGWEEYRLTPTEKDKAFKRLKRQFPDFAAFSKPAFFGV